MLSLSNSRNHLITNQNTITMDNIATQQATIYIKLVDGESLTTMDAFRFRNPITKLTTRISELINDYGLPVIKQREKNANGKGYHNRYSLAADTRRLLRNVSLKNAHAVLWPRSIN